LDLKTAVVGKNDESILKECTRGDITAVNEYEKVLNDPEYLLDSKGMIRQQLHNIQISLKTIKKLKDIVD
jgi:hypothetical protein